MSQRTSAWHGSWLTALLVAASIGLGLSGCAKDKITTGSITAGAPRLEALTAVELQRAIGPLGQAYARNPTDKTTALAYANALQMNGNPDQSLAVMRKLAIAEPRDRIVLAAYGKALAADGQFEPALDAVRRAQTPEYPDWRLLSAEGAILDQLGKPADARAFYSKALDLKPSEPSVLSNLGMSYVLEGDLRTAERYLREAAKSQGADSRVRQNLALVVGLQGRFQEAETIAKGDLPADEATANVAYLREMLSRKDKDHSRPPGNKAAVPVAALNRPD